MPDAKRYKCLLVSDFTIDNLARLLENSPEAPEIESIVAPFNQVLQVLKGTHECWKKGPDTAVIWTQPERVIPAFNRVLEFESVSVDELLREVDEYASLIGKAAERLKAVFVPQWVLPPHNRGLGLIEMKSNAGGIANTLMRMNLRLCENLAATNSIYVLNADRWMMVAGKKACNPKLWYLGKIAFGPEVLTEAQKDIKAALRAIEGRAKKLIITDLDNTLWGGVVGDEGWENLQLGGHDVAGEAYVDFQRALKSLINRGIILGIVSKNEENIALEAIQKHPEMVLRREDFVGWKINWDDKARNIVELVSDLNLGLDSVVFIDDNPVERARVKETLPEVLVPDWPEDVTLFKSTLLSMRCFDSPYISLEDGNRTKMYVSEQQRKQLKKEVSSLDDWLKSLAIEVVVDELNRVNINRAAQLLNKTNQMNLSTRRMSETELLDWASQANHKLWVFHLTDRFGDAGLVGMISLEITDGTRGKIIDFILSCRVMGRKVEEAMLYTAIEYARSTGMKTVCAQYIPTPKNKPCLTFLKTTHFEPNEKDDLFCFNLQQPLDLPNCIELKGLSS